MPMKLLEVGMGLAMMYVLLAMVVTGLMEFWAAAWDKRSRVLTRGLARMLGNAAKSLYEHGLVKSLQIGNGPPSYIPSGTFSLALLDLVAPGAKTPDDVAKSIESGATVVDDKLKESLRPLINAAEGKMDRLRNNIEGWFNAAMDRVSGTYRRSTQAGLLVTSLAVSGLINVDSIRIGTTLMQDDALRSATVALVDQTVTSQEFSDKVHAAAAATPKEEETQHNLVDARKKLDQSLSAVWELGMPIGWSETSLAYFLKRPFVSILGMLITAIAISQGAPFWFDILSRVAGIRSTVKPKTKQKSGEDAEDLSKN
jgi:hypothetical protein